LQFVGNFYVSKVNLIYRLCSLRICSPCYTYR